MPECMICGRRVRGDAWVCTLCEKAYPVLAQRYRDWPEWARFLQAEERKRRRRMPCVVQEITASDMEAVDRLLYGD